MRAVRRVGWCLAGLALALGAGAGAAAAASGSPTATPAPAPNLSAPATASPTSSLSASPAVSAPVSATAANPAASADGAALFAQNCSGCHGPRGEGRIGPPLAADAVASLPAGMITRGGISMPSFARQLTPIQIQAIADYVAGALSDPTARTASAAYGGQVFRLYCSGCHSSTGRGGALTRGDRNAPALAQYPAAEAIAAMILGRNNMPIFAANTLTNVQMTAVALYVEVLEKPPSPGGRGLGYYGPVTEGFVSILGLVALLAIAWWLASGKGSRTHG